MVKKQKEGKTYCFSRNFTDNVNRKKVTMANKVVREK